MNGEPNIGDLIRQLRDDTFSLVSEEVALAKTELSEKFSRLGRNLGYLAVGGLIALSALMMVLISASYLVAEILVRRGQDPGTATALGFLIVAVVVGVVSAVLISKAIKSLTSDSIKPERTVQSLREDKQWAQEKIS